MTDLARVLKESLADGEGVILVEVAEARGSTPREAGAAMLVTTQGARGTIGGGQLEFHAMAVAREMLAAGEPERRLALPLGPHLGQCCGGHVTLTLRRADAEDVAALEAREAEAAAARPAVLVFGAGHTGRALAAALAPLPLATRLIDDRRETLAPPPQGIGAERWDDPVDAVGTAPPRAAFVVLTHSHALDQRITEAALLRGDAAYVGLIGSRTKRARFESAFRARHDPAPLAGLVCPIGGAAVPDKRPAVIAALAAAEILAACLAPPPRPSVTPEGLSPWGA